MIIHRTIDDKTYEFTLTSHELFQAFEEQEHIFDVDDCEDVICGWDDGLVMDCFGVHADQFAELIDEIAWEKRRLQVKYDMSWDEARDTAIDTVLDKHYPDRNVK